MLLLSLINHSTYAQLPSLPDYDTETYYGYELGAAGITDTLIQFYHHGLNSSVLRDVINSTLEKIWSSQIEFQGVKVPAWGKYSGENTVYPGKKYGAAGILKTILSWSNGADIWLEYVDKGINELFNEALNSSTIPHWGYAYFLPNDPYGIPITDLKYGSAGILDLIYQRYLKNPNPDSLSQMNSIMNWLLSVAISIELSGQSFNIIPWYYIEDTTMPIKTSYEWGISGMIPLFIKVAKLLNNSTILNFSKKMLTFLVQTQEADGSWKTEINGSVTKIGYDEGVAGILYGLYESKLILNSSEFDNSIIKGVNYLFSSLKENSTFMGFLDRNVEYVQHDSFNKGTIGVLWVLLNLWQMLQEAQKTKTKDIISWFVLNELIQGRYNSKELILLKNSILPQNVFDLSLGEGLSGVLKLLFNVKTNLDLNNTKFNNLIQQIIETLINLRSENLWKRQIRFTSFLQTSPFKSLPSKSGSTASPAEIDLINFLIPIFIIHLIAKKRYKLKNNR